VRTRVLTVSLTGKRWDARTRVSAYPPGSDAGGGEPLIDPAMLVELS